MRFRYFFVYLYSKLIKIEITMRKIMTIIILLFLVLTVLSCDNHYEKKQVQAVVTDKVYTESSTTMMAVPYMVGKTHMVRMQPIQHPESFKLYIVYIDDATKDTEEVNSETFNKTSIGDTIVINRWVKCNPIKK